MVKQFYTSVRAAFKGVSLPLIHIYHPASPSIHRHHTAPHYFIAESVTHFTSASPAAFNISAATPDGPAALPLYALPIASLISYTDINLSSTGASSLFITSMLPILSLFQSNSSAVAHNILSTFALSLLP